MTDTNRCNHRAAWFFLLAFSLIVIGCSSGPRPSEVPVDSENSAQFLLGKTTLNEARQQMGWGKSLEGWYEGDTRIKVISLIYSDYKPALHGPVDERDYLELRFCRGILYSVSHGAKKDRDLTPASQIQINTSTQKDVLALMGKPDGRRLTDPLPKALESAGEEWTWRSGSSLNSVKVVFDNTGKVIKLDENDPRHKAYAGLFADLKHGKINEDLFLTLWSPTKAFEGYLGIIKAKRLNTNPEGIEYSLGTNFQKKKTPFPVWSYLPCQELRRFKNSSKISEMMFGAKGICYKKSSDKNWRIRYNGSTIKDDPVVMGFGGKEGQALPGTGWTFDDAIVDTLVRGTPASSAKTKYVVTFVNSTFKKILQVE